MLFSPPAVRRTRPFLILQIAAVLSAGCAATQRRELTVSEVHRALERRDVATLDEAALAGLEALDLQRPTAEQCSDPSSVGYWRACALAFQKPKK